MTKEIVSQSQGDKEGEIDDLIDFLHLCKESGATHYKMSWSNDPVWAFKYFETYRIKPSREIKEREIKILEERIQFLKQTISDETI